MLQIKDIKDRDSLKAWLEEQDSYEITVTIAHRAAMRVAPVTWDDLVLKSDKVDLALSGFLRQLLTSGVAAQCETPDVKKAAANAYSNELTISDFGAVTAAAYAAAIDSAYAATNYAAAADNVLSYVSDTASAYAASATASAATANAATEFDFWYWVQRDCGALMAGEDLNKAGLWFESEVITEGRWQLLKKALLNQKSNQATADSEANIDWSFWIDWYERSLDGTETRWDMLTEIGLLDPEIWKGEPNVLMREIYRIEKEHLEKAARKPQGTAEQVLQVNQTTIQTVKTGIANNRSALPPTFDALEQLLALEIQRVQDSNWLNAENPEEAKHLIDTFCTIHDCVEALRQKVPQQEDMSDDDAAEVVGLLKLYKDKLAELPRQKADEVVQGVWNTGKGSVQVGLILGTSALFTGLGFPALGGAIAGSAVFGVKNAADIVKAAQTDRLAKDNGDA